MHVCQRMITPLIIIGSIVFIHFSQMHIDEIREEVMDEELLYFPNEKLLSHFTGGMGNVVADLMWLQTISYTVKEFHNQDRKFTWLEHMCNTVTTLDPYFVDAYVNGGTFMAAIGAEEQALDYLKEGMVDNPESWEIPYEVAKVYLLNRKDEPEAPEIVTRYLRMVAERHEYPEAYLTWARRIQQQNDLDAGAREIWEDVLARSDDKFVKELARRNLIDIEVRETLDVLVMVSATFRAQEGRSPRDLHEMLQRGYLSQLPRMDEDYGEYFFDSKGEIQSTVVLDDTMNRMLNGINPQMILYKREHGKYPASIDELLVWYEGELPEHPYEGREWRYDPVKGRIY